MCKCLSIVEIEINKETLPLKMIPVEESIWCEIGLTQRELTVNDRINMSYLMQITEIN